MKKLTNLNGYKNLSKTSQKDIRGGFNFNPISSSCTGVSSSGDSNTHYGDGYSTACVGRSGKCTIDGYLASCNSNGGFYWY